VNVFNCAPATAAKHSGECPDGDALNLAVCQVPIDNVHFTSQVVTQKSTTAPSILTTRPSCAAGAFDVYVPGATTDATSGCLANGGHPDGRYFNVQMHDGASGLNAQNSPSYAQEFIPAIGTSVDMAAGYNRIHQVTTVLGPTAPGSGFGAAAGCQLEDMTDQIACLSQADPCSIGYAGDSGKAIQTAGISNPGASATGAWTGTTGALGGLDSVRAAQVYPSAATVQLLGQAGEYQIARKLYFNSLIGFANLNDTEAASELTIAKFEATPGYMNPIVVAQREFTLGSEFQGSPAGTSLVCQNATGDATCAAAGATVGELCGPAGLFCSDGTAAGDATCATAGSTANVTPCGQNSTSGIPKSAVCIQYTCVQANGVTPTSTPNPVAAVDPQFCEDFNEQMICNDVAGANANVNGCSGNGAVSLPAGAAGAAGSNPGTPAGADQVAGTSTICGDGIRQAYEECDNGTVTAPANGHATGNKNSDTTPGGCSTTCRCVNDFVNGNCD
jgi:hypothetical protein